MNIFRISKPSSHTKAYQGKNQYGNPSLISKHERGIDGIASDLGIILKSDLSRNVNLGLFESHQEGVKSNNLFFGQVTQGDLFSQKLNTTSVKSTYNGIFQESLYNGQLIVQGDMIGVLESVDHESRKAIFQPKQLNSN